MKKYLIYFAAVVAAASACTKELTPETQNVPEGQNGIPVSFTVGAPDLGEVDENGVETKITETVSGTTHNFKWTAGDIVNIYAFQSTPKAGVASASQVIDCGKFIAQNSGATATFSGTLPDSLGKYGYTKLYAIYNKGDKKSTYRYGNSAGKYTITNVWLDPNQDGSAFKYCQFAAKDWTLSYTKTSATDSVPSAIKTNSKKFYLSLPLLLIDTKAVSDDCKITKIEARYDYPDNKSTVEQYMAGNLTFATTSTGVNSAGSEKSITIYRDGAQLPDSVYLATRQTVGYRSTTSGGVTYEYGQCVLYLRFTYTEAGKEKIADFKMAEIGKSNSGDPTKPNFEAGKIYKLKPFTSLNGKAITKTISWTASSTSIIKAPKDSTTYKGFPYANDDSAGDVTRISDGKGGDSLTNVISYNGLRYRVERPYAFPNGKDTAILRVGALSNQKTAMYYYPKADTRIRLLDAYIEIPAFEGMRLASVYAEGDNGAYSNSVYVCSDLSKPTTSVIDECKARPIGGGKTTENIKFSYQFFNSKANTRYYFYLSSDRNIKKITYTYIDATK